jgi:hypothetical protein
MPCNSCQKPSSLYAPEWYEQEQHLDSTYMPSADYPDACDAGDAFWWALGGLVVGGIATFAVVALSDERTVKGFVRKTRAGIKKVIG